MTTSELSNTYSIQQVGMTRQHFQIGDAARIRMIVLHATAGAYPGDYEWLRQGGSASAPVSIHYYIDKQGNISQMVADANIAWHAGESTWIVDGQQINYAHGCNAVSVGIELENWNNGSDPYPQAQVDAAVWLTRQLVQTYAIPRNQLVRHLDIAPARKTDPRGFGWAQFVEDVYSPLEPEATPAEQLARLRARLVDFAYRTAGSAAPDGWTLLRGSISRNTGMPVRAITPPAHAKQPADANARAVRLAGQTLVVEAYGRDLLYAPPDNLLQIRQLSQTKVGTLRTALLEALFRAVDPVSGFRPDWAFHQYYLEHAATLGVPITPNYRLARRTRDGTAYVVQHFALDSLCAPVENWRQITRLSSLTEAMYAGDPHDAAARELRSLLLNDLYQQRTGTAFDATALFCRYAIQHQLGAPLGRAELFRFNGRQMVAMPFALDVIYCHIPADANWEGVPVNAMPPILGPATPPEIGRLSVLLHEPAQPTLGPDLPALIPPPYAGHLLGAPVQQVLERDLSLHLPPDPQQRAVPSAAPQRLLLVPAPPLDATEQPEQYWHAYLDRQGVFTRFSNLAQPAPLTNRSSSALPLVVLGIEGGTQNMPPAQRRALLCILRDVPPLVGLSQNHVYLAHRQP